MSVTFEQEVPMDKLQKDVLKIRRKALEQNWPPVFYYNSGWRPGYLKLKGRKWLHIVSLSPEGTIKTKRYLPNLVKEFDPESFDRCYSVDARWERKRKAKHG